MYYSYDHSIYPGWLDFPLNIVIITVTSQLVSLDRVAWCTVAMWHHVSRSLKKATHKVYSISYDCIAQRDFLFFLNTGITITINHLYYLTYMTYISSNMGIWLANEIRILHNSDITINLLIMTLKGGQTDKQTIVYSTLKLQWFQK